MAEGAEQFVLTELDLARLSAADVHRAEQAGKPHPERVPVGPFDTREQANAWAYRQCQRYGGGSWQVSPLRAPS